MASRKPSGQRAATMALAAVAFSSLLSIGCSRSLQPAVDASNAALRKVVIYRNGVAYFERYAAPDHDEVHLLVPTGRVDDFLKSLTVVDESSGRAVPVRYPTMDSGTGSLSMTIALPKKHGPLRIAYVTESPAWKPTYRVVLNDDGKAKLQGWAIVDNVTDEDWKQVRVGVGSTAALSFRYDLRSVREVQRKELSTGAPLALAPPAGGSAYAVPGAQLKVLGTLGESDLDRLPPPQRKADPPSGAVLTPQAQLTAASQMLREVEQIVTHVRRGTEAARKERDVVKTLCFNDKLSQLAVALGLVSGGLKTLKQATQRGDTALAQHEYTVLRILVQKARQLDGEANQCIGKESAYIGDETSVAVQVDPGLPQVDGFEDLPSRSYRRAPAQSGSSNADTPPATSSPPPRQRDPNYARNLVARLKQSKQRIRIEGFARSNDGDPIKASRQRAAALRYQLIARGIKADRIDVVGTGIINDRDAVRLIATDDPPVSAATTRGADEIGVYSTQPQDGALFIGKDLVSIGKGQSAMLSIVNATTKVERVYLYDPVSSRGSKRFTFNALKLVNPTAYTLDAGPLTVYGKGQFLGEGLTEPILAAATTIVPYALDRNVLVDPELSHRQLIVRLETILRGVATARFRRIRSTKLIFTNRAKRDVKVFVRHTVAPGFRLHSKHQGTQKLGGSYVIPVSVKATGQRELVIEEARLGKKTVDLKTPAGIEAIAKLLQSGGLAPALKKQLGGIVDGHAQQSKLAERASSLRGQIAVYRRRVKDINGQLVSLRGVTQASRLRRHLVTKMEDISNRLQRATIDLSNVRGELMTVRIALQDRIATMVFGAKPAASDTSAVAAKPPAATIGAGRADQLRPSP